MFVLLYASIFCQTWLLPLSCFLQCVCICILYIVWSIPADAWLYVFYSCRFLNNFKIAWPELAVWMQLYKYIPCPSGTLTGYWFSILFDCQRFWLLLECNMRSAHITNWLIIVLFGATLWSFGFMSPSGFMPLLFRCIIVLDCFWMGLIDKVSLAMYVIRIALKPFVAASLFVCFHTKMAWRLLRWIRALHATGSKLNGYDRLTPQKTHNSDAV